MNLEPTCSESFYVDFEGTFDLELWSRFSRVFSREVPDSLIDLVVEVVTVHREDWIFDKG